MLLDEATQKIHLSEKDGIGDLLCHFALPFQVLAAPFNQSRNGESHGDVSSQGNTAL